MATAGLMAPLMKSYTIDGNKQIVWGIYEEFVRRMEHKGGAIHPSCISTGTSLTGFLTFGQDHITPFNPETFKLVADELVRENSIRVFFHGQFIDTICDGGCISKILITDKSGIRAIQGKQFIDCSGDADVAVKAGVPYVLGDGYGNMQPATTMFRVSNVATEKTRRYVEEHPEDFMFINLAQKAREAGDFPINRRRAIIFETPYPGQWVINSTRVQQFNGTDADQRSEAEMEGRRQVEIVVNYLRKYIPGFENALLMDSGNEIGARETRHIEGKYMLTIEDVMSGKHFEDCIAISGFPMDIHDNKGTADLFEQPKDINFYEIPYRCMVPKKIENLLVAGRPVSATHQAAGAVRVMPTCFAMGQAAGIAAALSFENYCSVQNLDITALHEALVEAGACLGL